MPRYAACLVDVFETVLTVDLDRATTLLAQEAGVEPGRFAAAVVPWARPIMDGSTSLERALEEVLVSCGTAVDDGKLGRLVAADGRLLLDLAVVYEDTVPFLGSLRTKGVRTAYVSNCAANTRPLLDALGLSGLVDDLVLSCEVGATKPDAHIFRTALDRLGVAANQSLFVDDQQEYCDGAAAVGIRAVRIDRSAGSGEVSMLSELLRCF